MIERLDKLRSNCVLNKKLTVTEKIEVAGIILNMNLPDKDKYEYLDILTDPDENDLWLVYTLESILIREEVRRGMGS